MSDGALATFRIEARAMADLDSHIAHLGWARLIRNDGDLLLECAAEDALRAAALLARAGARCVAAEHLIVAGDLLPAIVTHLAPVTMPGAIDCITLRPLDVGEATARLQSRRRAILRGRREHGGVRTILRGDDRLIAWRRVLWARPSLFRTQHLRGARPIVFDRGALGRAAERYTNRQAGELTRWAQG